MSNEIKVLDQERTAELWEAVKDKISKIPASGAGLNISIKEVTLLAYGWDEDNQQTVTVEGVSADIMKQIIEPVPKQDSEVSYYDNQVIVIEQGDNTLTFSCIEVPLIDLNLYVVITGTENSGNSEDSSITNNVYSLEETVVGTWIDGKPIYRKVYVVNELSTTSVTGEYLVAKNEEWGGLIDHFVRTEANINGNTFPFLTNVTNDEKNEMVLFSLSSARSGYVSVISSKITDQGLVRMPEVRFSRLSVILEYTKTADSVFET